MAEVLPSDEALSKHYKFMDVDLNIPDRDRDGAYINATGTVIDVKVDGEDSCILIVEVEVPLEDIPEL